MILPELTDVDTIAEAAAVAAQAPDGRLGAPEASEPPER